MHVAVDPRRGAAAVGLAPDLEQPEIAPLGAFADTRHADKLGVRPRPVMDEAADLFVAQVAAAKCTDGHRASASRPMMPSVRKAIASPAIRPPPMSDMVLMSLPRSGSVPEPPARRRRAAQFQTEEKMPPAPNQNEVHHSTKPPKLEAYGLGMMIASRMKSAVFVAALRTFHTW